MPGVSCLYRRSSGIYVVRLAVPVRLRPSIGRGEIHVSTGLRDLGAAKLAALTIQYRWRAKFMSLDLEKLKTENPMLQGGGLIPVSEAARLIGLSDASLLSELRALGAGLVTQAQHWHGWVVDDVDSIDREAEGCFVLNDVETKGERRVFSGLVRSFREPVTISSLMATGQAKETVFRLSGRQALWLEEEVEIPLAAWLVQKQAAEIIRQRLAAFIPSDLDHRPSPAESLLSEDSNAAPSPAAKPARRRFSELFELHRNHRNWGKAQERRMQTEAGLFSELMDDPHLDEILVETIHEYAKRLGRLPNDIYQSRRRFKADSLKELMEIAQRQSLPLKKPRTVRGHVGRVAEILNFAASKGMMPVNPAAGFKREWSVGKKVRAQDERDEFTQDDLALIFSQAWFSSGSGEFSARGATDWRPHYFWLPLLALLTGGRLNELAQLYLTDICKSEEHESVWYVDFNLNEPDKLEADEDDEWVRDKSLKTVNAIRVVPLHDLLIEAGLPAYIEALRKDGHTRLFPELKRDSVKGYGKPAGSWFNERFLGRRLGIRRNGRKTFHSFRHNFATAVERLDIPERVMAQLLGHERGETQGGTRYAKDRSAAKLKPMMDRLIFPCLSGLGAFDIASGIRAVKYAARRKTAIRRAVSARNKV